MMDKLQAISDRLEAVVTQMEDPATYADPDLLRRLTREQKELEPVVEAYRAYGQAEADLASAQELLNDPEMKEMAQEEIQRARADMERLREELKLLLLPRDPNDGKNVVMEIRGGVGGEEAMLFAADLFRMYVMYVESRGWSLEVTSRSWEASRPSSSSWKGRGPGPASSTRAEPTGSSGCLSPNPPDASRPAPPPWRSCRRRRRWTSTSTPAI